MKKFFVFVILAMLFGSAGCHFFANHPKPDHPPRVLAHYMPWFKAEKLPDGQIAWEHWQWFGKGPKHDPDKILANGRRDIASVFYPLIGPYDGRDPNVLEYHLLTARAAGIDGFVADWYGPGSSTDEIFAKLVNAAERYGMKVAICLEEKSFFPGYSPAASRAEAQAVMEQHIRHVLEQYTPSPAYLRRKGQPVFFIFIGHEQNAALGNHFFTPAETAEVLGRFKENPILLTRGHLDSNFFGVARGSYAWCGDRKYRDWYYPYAKSARADDRIQYFAGVASPGFDDSGVNGWGVSPRVTDRRGTAEYEDNWKELLPHQPDYVQIVTWNDFQEGTTIEPAEEYQFQFVDLTDQYAAQYTGGEPYLADNRWPLRIYQLRQKLRAAPTDRRDALTRKLDRFVLDFMNGKRFLMAYRLRSLEKALE